MDLGLEGKAVLVTGGSRGIGREIALTFAREGANVAICARDLTQLQKTEEEIRALGVKAYSLSVDLFLAEGCRRAVDDAAAALGRLDILINNASTKVSGSLEFATDDQLMERLIGKTLASMRCTRAALPHFRAAGGGRIVCIGGTSLRQPSPTSLPGALGNAAVASFVQNYSEEAARENILINAVHPPFTKTDPDDSRIAGRAKRLGVSFAEAEAYYAKEFPIGRVVETWDVAPLVVFLTSRQAGAITGESFVVDGGATRAVAH